MEGFVNHSWFSFLVVILALHGVVLFYEIKESEGKKREAISVQIVHDNGKLRRIVRSQGFESERPLDKGAYLSDKNRLVKRQTRARENLELSSLGAYSPGHHPLKVAAQKNQQGVRGSSSEYLPEVELGEVSELNTVQFKYYGYFQRIKDRLEQYWGVSVKEKVRELVRRGRAIAGNDQFVTGIKVILNTKGEVISVQMRSGSGVTEFDQAAQEAFMNAGPFAHPPRGLIREGKVEIEWGFVIDT
jgi:TonB family protein